MSHPQLQPARHQSEMQLLRCLCDADASAFERGKLAQMLNNYHWAAPDHTILFECICELLARDPRKILEHLPGALTRRGFPEISYDSLGASPQMAMTDAFAHAQELLRASQ